MKLLIALISIVSLQVMAVEETEPKYRYPSDLSDAEHKHMIQIRGKYAECLNKEARANLDKYEDFRKIADVAMENCKATLVKIDADLTEMNLDPDFRRYFLRKASQKSAQKLLPELMALKSR